MSVSLNDLPNKVFSSGDTVTVTTGSGIEGPQGPTGATGAGGTVAYFGNFFSTETQANADVSAANTFTLNSTVDANGVSIVDGTKITFAAGSDGTYDLQFSAQFDKTDSGTDEVDIWISKNGTDLEWSNTVLSLVGNNAKAVPAWNWQLNDVVGGDYFELHWWSPDSAMRVLAVAAGSNPTRPAVPSLIVTVAQVTYTQAGAAGAAATVAVGSTTTGAAGTSASVTNSGTSSAAVLNFTIPRGDTGATGATGPEGGTSTLTTKGDLLTRTTSAVARLPVGATDGHILTVDAAEATGMKWAAAPASGIPETLIDAKGDLIVGTAADTVARLPVGTNNYLLTANTGGTAGLTWTRNNSASTAFGTYNTTTGTSRVYIPPGVVTAVVSGASCAQVARWWIYSTEKLVEVKRIWTFVSTLEAGATQRLGIYAVNDNAEPTTLIADYGTVSAASTGAKSASGSTTVVGLFAVAMWSSNHTTVRYYRSGAPTYWAMFGDSGFLSSTGQVCWGIESVDYSAGLPASAPTPHAQMSLKSDTQSLTVPGVTLG